MVVAGVRVMTYVCATEKNTISKMAAIVLGRKSFSEE